MTRHPILVLLASVTVACTPKGDDTGLDDTGSSPTTPDVAWIAAGTPDVAAPDIPWLEAGLEVAPPEFSCRDGWSPTTLDNGATICEPWPTGARLTCDSSTAMQLPGAADCAEVGTACPAGDWSETLPATGVWYVAPGGTGDGTSASSPMGSVADAIAAAAAGDTVALAKGTYDEAITVTGEVEIVGACAAGTTLTATTIDEADAAVTLEGGSLTLRDLQISGSAGRGLASSAGTLDVDGVAFVADTVYNAYLENTTATMNDVLFSDGQPSPTDGEHGYGLASISSTLTLTHASVVHNYGLGVKLEDGTATVDDVAIVDVMPRLSDQNLGGGFVVYGAGVAAVSGVVVEDTYNEGIHVKHDGQLTLTDSVVRRTNPQAAEQLYGYALVVTGNTTVDVERVYLDDYANAAVLVNEEEDTDVAAVSLTDVVLTNGVHPPGDVVGGYGILGNSGGTLSLTRVVATDNEAPAVALQDTVVATLTDVRLERSGLLGDHGAGLEVHGADVTITRAWLVDNEGMGLFADVGANIVATDVYVAAPSVTAATTVPPGIFVTGVDTLSFSRVVVEDVAYLGLYVDLSGEVALSDIVVRRVTPDGDGTYGVGLVASGNTSAQVDRVDVSDTRMIGVDFVGSAEVNDLRVTRTTSGAGAGHLGLGVFLEDADVTGARWMVKDSQNVGVGLLDSAVTVSDLLVTGVTPRACAATTCPEDGGAAGVYVDATSSLDLSSFLVEGTDGVGVQSAGDAAATDGYVRDAAYGTEVSGAGAVTLTRVDVSEATAATPSNAQPVPSLAY